VAAETSKQRNVWISVFQRTGQRFVCTACGFAGDFNAFRLDLGGEASKIRFLCPNCQHDLGFDPVTEDMVSGHGEMLHPEVSLAGRWRIARLRQALVVGSIMAAVILLVVYLLFARLGIRLESLDSHFKDLASRQAQSSGLGGRVELSFPGFQEIGAGYAVMPRSAVRESSGMRIKGVVVNEKAFTVDARFRLSQGSASQTFYVENVLPGTGETFDVFLSGASDTSGKIMVEVVETNLRLE